MVQLIQPEILNRVFKLVYGDPYKQSFSSGTAFTMECNDSQFLITARHVFEQSAEWTYPNEGTIWLLTDNGKYTLYEVDIKYPADTKVDIAVMRLKNHQYVSKNPNLNTNEGNINEELILGQDVFFLGFPYDYGTLLMPFSGSERPMPVIKKACFSGRLKGGHACMVFDGLNNPGFSGGPVCYRSTDAPNGTMSIAAVISGYFPEKQDVLDENGRPTGSYVKSNTGIITAYDIKEAVQVAERWDDTECHECHIIDEDE